MGHFHKDLPAEELHPPGFAQESDPGSVGAGMDWFQPSTRRLRRRTSGNDGWLDVRPALGITAVAGPSHQLTLSDLGGLVRLEHETAASLVVPEDATLEFPVGAMIRVEQAGEGVIIVTPESTSPTIESLHDHVVTAGRHAVVTLVKTGADRWLLTGDLIQGGS